MGFLVGIIIGILAEEDRLYLKADAQSESHFVTAGSHEWTYEGKHKPIRMGYWSVPESAFDDKDEMTRWAKLAYAAAVRKTNASPKKAKTRKTAKSSAVINKLSTSKANPNLAR
jgi:DNA transformation protein and related proteins